MNTGNSNRSRSIFSGALALVVTTLLMSSLVGSFDPAQLEQIEGATQDQQAMVQARRLATSGTWT